MCQEKLSRTVQCDAILLIGKLPKNYIIGSGVGHVLQCKHGDVLVYNPTHPHGTTEFDLHPNEPESGRIFFAFFMKKNVLHADLLSQAMVNRVGVQNIKLP
jgi:hypothetical protein